MTFYKANMLLNRIAYNRTSKGMLEIVQQCDSPEDSGHQ